MKGRKLTHSAVAKTIAFFLVVLMTLLAVGCVLGAVVLVQGDFYIRSKEQIIDDELYYPARSDSRTALYLVLQGDEEGLWRSFENTNFSYEIIDSQGARLADTRKAGQTKPNYTFVIEKDELGVPELVGEETYEVRAYIDQSLSQTDKYSLLHKLLSLGHDLRYAVYAIGILAGLLAAACFIFLLFAAGHRAGQEKLYAGGLVKVPLDLLVVAVGFLIFVALSLFFDNVSYHTSDLFAFMLVVLATVVALAVGMGLCMNFAVRVKLGRWWENTVAYRLLAFCWRLLKGLWRGFVGLFLNLPLIWKTALLLTGITAIEFLIFVAFYYDTSWILMAWILTRPVVLPGVLYLALVLRRLQKGGEALAEGDLSYQVNTKYMIWDFKKHGEKLNCIAEGMARAVEERLKSERFKTELITNVSHDIKTPLTSIVNYAELIGREETENPQITEYTQVLLRQSERLKSMIENLVEASKASTGNVEVLLAPCEVGVLLTQAVGEYEQRLADRELALIVKQPETPVRIMADGRLLWRVFDNLMNNICKYAQSGTRVYLSIEVKGDEAVTSFKNTSSYALDIPADELFERFVRNDAARSSEGNGLGLSIAQSLTELQNGKLALTVDGDLFKATLHFPVLG